MTRLLPLLVFWAMMAPAFAGLPTPSLGAQFSLTTGITRFEIPRDPAKMNVTERRAAPYAYRGAFVANATLTNLSRTDFTLHYPDSAAADARFHFSVVNSEGHLVWESEVPAADPAESEIVTLAPRAVLRRTLLVPLKTADGQWLPGGRYTLRAEAGTGDALSALAFEIVGRPITPGTGIHGQLFFRPLIFPHNIIDGTIVTPIPHTGFSFSSSASVFSYYNTTYTLNLAAIPVPGTIYISEVRDAGVLYDHPPFNATVPTNSLGEFSVATPPGRFHLLASSPNVIQPAYFAPNWTTVTVAAGQFTETKITITGSLRIPQPTAE